MTEKSEPSFGHIKALHFEGTKKRIAEGEYVSPERLVELIRSRGDVAVPDEILEYICAHLLGEIAKPKGRPRLPDVFIKQRDMLISTEYRRLLSLFQDSDLSPDDVKLYGTEPQKNKNYTPSERAARLIAKLFLSGEESWTTARNIASSQK